MRKRVFQVTVTRTINVTIDEAKFPWMTEDQNKEFRSTFYNFHDLEDHVEHLGWLAAVRQDGGFVEGYGPLTECGVEIEELDGDEIEAEEIRG